MFNTFYQFFRYYGIEGMLQFAILSYALYILCGPRKDTLPAWKYVLGSTCVAGIIMVIVRIFISESYYSFLSVGAIPYWVSSIESIGIQLLFAYLLLRESISYKLVYILYFIAFLQLFKVVCAPLYTAEASMSPRLYQVFDLLTIGLLLAFLILLTYMFRKFKFYIAVKLPFQGIVFALYFPVSILVCYGVAVNNRTVYGHIIPITAFLILTNLPLIYYIFSIINKSYEEQKKLDDALTQTKAQLARFRFSIELEERLKKERHELKNNYFYIQTLINEKKYDQLNDYMENVIGEKLSGLNEIQTGNMLMDYLLNRKIGEAHKYHIKTYVEVLVPSQLNISEDILCTILLNLLDNAIEASQKESHPDIHITINCVQNYLVAKISNKASEPILNTNPSLTTTKKDFRNHGLGLKIIRQAVRRSNGIFQISNEEGYFTATIMLPINYHEQSPEQI